MADRKRPILTVVKEDRTDGEGEEGCDDAGDPVARTTPDLRVAEKTVLTFNGDFHAHVNSVNLTHLESSQIEELVMDFLRCHRKLWAIESICAALHATVVELTVVLKSTDPFRELEFVGVRTDTFEVARAKLYEQAVGLLLQMQRMGVHSFDAGTGKFGGTPEFFLEAYQQPSPQPPRSA